jgi:hypothetical protein
VDIRDLSHLSVVEQLQLLNAHRDLIRAAKAGYVREVRCSMPVCSYPDPEPPRARDPHPDPGSEGRWMFDVNPEKGDPPPWGIDRDRYPLRQPQDAGDGLYNIRPAHVVCKQLGGRYVSEK